MAGHRDSVVSITVGSQVGGVKVNEALVDKIWGPNTTMDAVVEGMRGYLRIMLIIGYQARQGGSLAEAETYVDQNSGATE